MSTRPPGCDWLMAELLTLPPPLELELELLLELLPPVWLHAWPPVPYMVSVDGGRNKHTVRPWLRVGMLGAIEGKLCCYDIVIITIQTVIYF